MLDCDAKMLGSEPHPQKSAAEAMLADSASL